MYESSWKRIIEKVSIYNKKEKKKRKEIQSPLKYWNMLPNELSTSKMDCDKLMQVIGCKVTSNGGEIE